MIAILDSGHNSFIYDTDNNRKCDCGHIIWYIFSRSVVPYTACAWCGEWFTPTGLSRLDTSTMLNLLRKEYGLANDSDKIQIMAKILGQNEEK